MIVLGLASFFKGERLLAEYKRLGCHTVVLATADLRERPWSREVIDELFFVPDFNDQTVLLNVVAYLTRERNFELVVPLEEYVVDTAARVRSFLGCPGLDEGAARNARDKHSMRCRARDCSIPVPAFELFACGQRIARFLETVPPPWLVKPRAEGGAVQIHKLQHSDQVWELWARLGDMASRHLIEAYLPGEVYHVDSVIHRGQVVMALANQYGKPPFDIWHSGGVFFSRTVPAKTKLSSELLKLNAQVLEAMGITQGVNHVEFIGRQGQLYFLEVGARVAGANLDRLTTAATGVNLFHESARLELDLVRNDYTPPKAAKNEAGILVCLTRDQCPDLSFAGDSPEVTWRLSDDHHAGLALASKSSARVDELLRRFGEQLGHQLAVLPPADKPC